MSLFLCGGAFLFAFLFFFFLRVFQQVLRILKYFPYFKAPHIFTQEHWDKNY